jgi:flagellar L-ring protein FlgH
MKNRHRFTESETCTGLRHKPWVLILLGVGLSGCAAVTAPKVEMLTSAPMAMQSAPAQAPHTNGSIFQAASYRPLFEDRRARLVGDVLTIQIEERVTASQQSSSKVDKSGSAQAGVSVAPLMKPNILDKFTQVEGSSKLASDAKGQTDSTNTFSGTITVLVQQVLPNGNLLVTGEKQIGVNQNVDVMRFSGIVNPATIRAGNVVSSAQVAEARVEQRGRGDIGRSQGAGWLSRFFLSFAPV